MIQTMMIAMKNDNVWYLINSDASNDCECTLDDNDRGIAIDEDKYYIHNHHLM